MKTSRPARFDCTFIKCAMSILKAEAAFVKFSHVLVTRHGPRTMRMELKIMTSGVSSTQHNVMRCQVTSLEEFTVHHAVFVCFPNQNVIFPGFPRHKGYTCAEKDTDRV